MDTRKRWHLWLIVCVLALTLYNILPTVFFYARPLNEPIGPQTGQQVAEQIAQRVNHLEKESVDWVKAYAKNLGISPKQVAIAPNDPKLIEVQLASESDAKKFNRYLSKAGALIPFAPAQLAPAPLLDPNSTSRALVARSVATRFPEEQLNTYFSFAENNSSLHRQIALSRAATVAMSVGGTSDESRLSAALTATDAPLAADALLHLATQIVDYQRVLGLKNPITQRFYSTLSQGPTLAAKFDLLSKEFTTQIETKGANRESSRTLERQKETLAGASAIIKGNLSLFQQKQKPLTFEEAYRALESSSSLSFEGRNPFIEKMALDLASGTITLEPFAEVKALLQKEGLGEEAHYQAEKLDTLLLNTIAGISRASGEQIDPSGVSFAIALSSLPGSQSFLALDLGAVAKQRATDIESRLQEQWMPTASDLARENFPIWDWKTFKALSPEQQKLGLLVYAPVAQTETPPEGFRKGSIYVIARGFGSILQKEGGFKSDGPLAADFQKLQLLLAEDRFFAYPGNEFGIDPRFKDDLIFELDGYYNDLLAATREKFTVHGDQRYAVLEFSDERQRLLTTNEIETAIHEDLIKWRDLYNAARIDSRSNAKLEVPPPTRNVLLDNFKLSFVKYFRGDDRKILKWGLDLSGGKSVTIGLSDQNGKAVTDPDDLRQGINELQGRVNKMGVSEVEIRQEGDHILLNFPGAQGLSASELIQASTMTFHIVNEKFNPRGTELAAASTRFLQDVWNEAVVTGRKGAKEINAIAFQHLGGDEQAPGRRSPSAQLLFENGLRLADPALVELSSDFNETLSAIAVLRGNGPAEWLGQANPLLFVFANYALEGTNLENVHAAYDPAQGNLLVFNIKSGAREALYSWTSQFAQEKIGGTEREIYSGGDGWRMAAILNGEVVSAPVLKGALSHSAQVTGSFSQREINGLVADLKAGSLSFTPQVLSEKNVSPDLGKSERTQGIVATVIGLALVILAMIWYYRFGGLVAGCAVILNLLIMWGVLQNLDAALTLPGIAGIILTMGMAVDANVLVFERVREEFAISKRIASAVQVGYRKAFSAIFDSNITTIIAALILLNFEAGPIKAFAITLIIGICSSMFTALFMTRYFFLGWVQKGGNVELKMRNLFQKTHFDFLKRAKGAVTFSLIVIAIGGALLFMQRHTILGMDFTGGYALTIDLEAREGGNYRALVEDALTHAGASQSDFVIRTLNQPNQLRLQFGTSMEEAGHPFYHLGEDQRADSAVYSFEHNPRITWVVGALEASGLYLRPETLPTLNDQWNVISGQFSDKMRNSALIGLGLALIAIFLYIALRFEFKYAMSATIALGHDLLITLGILGILHWLKVPVQIDLQVVGALMTIVGYSLNDTIVIFDRIREDTRLLRKLSFRDLINSSLNSTLNRTLLTSLTTLLVLIALDVFGGMAIFDFSIVMTIGVVFGTFSSLFIATPLLLYFHNREQGKEVIQTQRRSA
ncbi:MAG: protein translocase subunit SecD [Verrucomicrobia bacterium]|nr:protein translocase subunit SecD [Verrucomicrobiota bacterium]